jgi:hypothetical protein
VSQPLEQLHVLLGVVERRDVEGGDHQDLVGEVERPHRGLVPVARHVQHHPVEALSQDADQLVDVRALDQLRVLDTRRRGQDVDAARVLVEDALHEVRV